MSPVVERSLRNHRVPGERLRAPGRGTSVFGRAPGPLSGVLVKNVSCRWWSQNPLYHRIQAVIPFGDQAPLSRCQDTQLLEPIPTPSAEDLPRPQGDHARVAANMPGVGRVAEATKLRGLYP